MAWVTRYEDAWRANDADAVETLFTPDASYRRSPYLPPEVGHGQIRAIWCDDGETFTMRAEPVAVEDRSAVVRLLVRYGDPVRQEYKDLWVLRFAPDGRVADFEEWPYEPGQPDAAAGD
ncbi:nuclear transport factor 2 family protein [Pengzhenrongella sp.]|uniref:nuclear transport factor 2 family protein n=1 Tax=Pengzhenrongella sp. TaxID=2888820 RepID=UPI002F94E596